MYHEVIIGQSDKPQPERELGYHSHAVPWYCGPVAEGESEGGYKTVCARCYGRWEAWDASLRYCGA